MNNALQAITWLKYRNTWYGSAGHGVLYIILHQKYAETYTATDLVNGREIGSNCRLVERDRRQSPDIRCSSLEEAKDRCERHFRLVAIQ